MIGVAPRLGAEIKNSAGEFAELRPQVAGLDFELANRVLSRNDDWKVDVADVERLSIQIFSALVGKGAAHLIVAVAERILSDRSPASSALCDGARRDGHQVENIPPVQRKFVGFALIDDVAERGSFDLQQRAFGSDLYALASLADRQRRIDVSVLLYLHNHAVASNVLEAFLFEVQTIGPRHDVDELIEPLVPSGLSASFLGT